MRRSKADLRERVNGNLDVSVRARRADVARGPGVRPALSAARRGGRVAAAGARRRRCRAPTSACRGMVLVMLALLISGGRRLRHLRYLDGDPLVLRLCGLTRLPTAAHGRPVAGAFRARHLPRLHALNAARRRPRDPPHRRAAADDRRRRLGRVDGPAGAVGAARLQSASSQGAELLSDHGLRGAERAGAARAESAGQRARRQSGAAVSAGRCSRSSRRRSATATPANSAWMAPFSAATCSRCSTGRAPSTRSRCPSIRGWGSRSQVRQTRVWTRVTATVSCAEHAIDVAPWERHLRVVVYRTPRAARDGEELPARSLRPDDGHYEYTAVATNKTLGGAALWAFMCGRGTHEQVYGELKSGFAFACVPTMRYAANSAWQILSVLAFNLVPRLPTRDDRRAAPATRKRRTRLRLRDDPHAPLPLLRARRRPRCIPDGYATLDVGPAPAVVDRFKRLDRLLKAA